MACFRALSRLYDSFVPDLTPQRRAFVRGLTMVAEHTWGVDIKTYLRDDMAWDREDFERARATDYRFAYAQESWAEQRAYLDAAVDELDPVDHALVQAALLQAPVPARAEGIAGATIKSNGWSASIDATTGDIAALAASDGQALLGRDGSLFGYRHESYDSATLQTRLDSYLQHRVEWAILDHDKPGLAAARTARSAAYAPVASGIARNETAALGAMPEQARQLLGAPAAHELILRGIDASAVEITLVLHDKLANRMPEAGFLQLTLDHAQSWAIEKLGLWHALGGIVRRGGGQLRACTALWFAAPQSRVRVDLLDAALVAPAGAPIMPFQPEAPDLSQGESTCQPLQQQIGHQFPNAVARFCCLPLCAEARVPLVRPHFTGEASTKR